MHPAQFPRVRLLGLLALLIITSAAPAAVLVGHTPSLQAQSAVRSLHPDIQVHHILDTGTSPASVRLAKDPRTNTLFYLKQNGDIYRVNLSRATSTRTYTTTHHKVRNTQGFALGPDGTMYLVGNEDRPNSQTRATIVKGVPDANGNRVWSTLAQTADYPKSNTAYDHRFNGLVVRPSGSYLFVNSGSRTDHGEIQTAGGLYPDTREVGLTACVLRLPTSGHNLSLPNDRAALKQAGYIFAEGTRNSFDLAFAPNGNLFATENGPDRDMSEELNWLRSGRHYGFPWRIGGANNPQQYPDYDPSTDLLLDPRYGAVKNGYYHTDPTFPPRPSRTLTEPVVNAGPDADSYRDPQDGQIKDASDQNQTLSTFTAHRSPLGLVFDRAGALSPEFNGDGFMLSWQAGDPTGDTIKGPFKDASQDLVHLDLTQTTETTYTVRTTRLIEAFSNPIDAEIIGNKIYVLEYGGNGGLWKITLPAQ